MGKLKSLGSFLTSWSKRKIGCIKNKIGKLKKKLLHLQGLNPSVDTLQQEKVTSDQLNEYIIMEATYWEQRMKQIWLKTGDRNSKRFHLSVQQRRQKNNNSSLQASNGQWITNPGAIADELISFFKNLFQEDFNVRHPSDLQQSAFSMDDAANLSIAATPTSDTVWKVVKAMNPFGSPGPDGFPVILYKKCWSIVGEETVKVHPRYLQHC
ncbi:uncharacterized protein LOC113295336 [Papaver somniferum]|uniref:uncharacterized protein LOC113295336 n=1 Tax=Papaver somniferum TaxID=3469 RepID=UPI000E6FE825|nr:uncharacterized protein LOC113295336 [Papaver somniferum]